MKIDVISDTICPWCYIGKRRLERALAEHPELDPEIVWHPFQLNPDMPPEGMDRDMYLQVKFGGPTRAKEVYRVIAQAASSEALNFKLDKIGRTPSTLDSHRLVHFAALKGAQQAVVEGLFKAYF
jgi:predicted DsbA family dithiol-disulfide isomerase